MRKRWEGEKGGKEGEGRGQEGGERDGEEKGTYPILVRDSELWLVEAGWRTGGCRPHLPRYYFL